MLEFSLKIKKATHWKMACAYCGKVRGFKSMTGYNGKRFCKDNDCMKKWRYESMVNRYGKRVMAEFKDRLC